MHTYCVKCCAKREMKDAQGMTMKNGGSATLWKICRAGQL